MIKTEVLLGEVCNITNGYAFDSNKFSTTEGFPLIRIRDLKKSNCVHAQNRQFFLLN